MSKHKIGVLVALSNREHGTALQKLIVDQLTHRNTESEKFTIGITSHLSDETDKIALAIKHKVVSILVIEINDPDERWKRILEARAAGIPVICICHGEHIYTAARQLTAIPIRSHSIKTTLIKCAFEVVNVIQTIEDTLKQVGRSN